MFRSIRRSRRVAAALVFTFAGFAVTAAPVTVDAGGGRAGHHQPADPTVRQKEVARDVVEDLGRGRAEIVRRAFAPDFVDHVTGDSGRDALIAGTKAQRAEHPRARATVYRVIAQGDLVFVHSNLILEPGTLGESRADLYRFANGRIVEHWGAAQVVPATTASGNDMFSTLSSPRRLSPDPNADPAVTQQTMFGLFGAVVGAKDLTAYDRFIQEPYYQHSTNTPNGIQAVKAIWGPILIDPALQIDFVNSVVEGDLFVSFSVLRGPTIDAIAVDISRVRDGKIVEHWDVVQPL